MDKGLLLRKHKNYTLWRIKLPSSLPALIVKPTDRTPPYPAIFFLHPYQGSKENLKLLAQDIGKAGFLALAIDMEYHGERKKPGKDILSPNLKEDRAAFYRTQQSALEALHFLETCPEVNQKCIFFLGVSLGSIIGVSICQKYSGFKGIFLVVGGGNLEFLVKESMLDSLINIRYHLKKEGISIQKALTGWENLEPLSCVSSRSGVPFYFFNASRDIIVPQECTIELFDRTPSPKNIRWFPTGHNLLFERKFGVSQLILEKMVKQISFSEI